VRTVNADQLNYVFSPINVHTAWGVPYEPVLSLSSMLVTSGDGSSLGPLSATAQLPFWVDSDVKVGPFVHFSTPSVQPSLPMVDREIYTIGARIDGKPGNHYFSFSLGYTLPSSYNSSSTANGSGYIFNFGSVASLSFRGGTKFGRFLVGGLFDYDQSAGYSVSSNMAQPYSGSILQNQNSFSLVRAGPQLGWDFGRLKADLSAEWMLNNDQGQTHSLNDLGDFAGHGAGTSFMNMNLSYHW
jgi:hypothetical protein